VYVLAAAIFPISSSARLAITSLAFMLVEVPDPVWKVDNKLIVEFSCDNFLGSIADGAGDWAI
jgi:hypothetical protein